MSRLFVIVLCAASTAAQPPALSANVLAGGIDSSQRAQKGSRIRRSRALGLVRAPAQKVTDAVLDYGNYHHFMPSFVASRVLAQRGSQALVYMEVSALHGMATLWAEMQLRMLPGGNENETHVIATLVKGNLKDFQAEWQVTSFDASHTLVAFELCADPDFRIPFASGLVSDYNEKEARASIDGLRHYLRSSAAAPAR